MSSRSLDPRPWLACLALGCALGAYVCSPMVPLPSALDGALTAPPSPRSTDVPVRPGDPEAPTGFVPLVWTKGVDPRPVTIAA